MVKKALLFYFHGWFMRNRYLAGFDAICFCAVPPDPADPVEQM
jgi:hypothetical protein